MLFRIRRTLIAALVGLAVICAGCTPETFVSLAPVPAPTSPPVRRADVDARPVSPIERAAADVAAAPEADEVADAISDEATAVETTDPPAGEETVPVPEAPPAGDEPPAETLTPQLVYGETRRGEITDGHLADAWAFAGDAGDAIVVAVEATSGNLDAVVALLDEQGSPVLSAGSDGEGDERRVLVLPYAGLFQLAVTPVEGTRGGYTIGLAQTTIQSLHIGETRRGQLTTAEPVAVWRLQGPPGADVELQARSDDDHGPRLFLLDTGADEQPLLGEGDGLAGTLVVRLPDSGQIQIGVTERERRAGAYSLQAALAVADEPEADAATSAVSIPRRSWRSLSFGEIWADDIDLEDQVIINGREQYAHVYSLEGEAGRTSVFDIDADVDGSPLDSVLRLYDAEWNLLDYDDDDGSSLDSFLAYTFAATGEYYLVVAAYPGTAPTASSRFDYYLATHYGTGLEADLRAAAWWPVRSDGNPEPFPIRVDVAAGDIDVEQTELGWEGQRCAGWTTAHPSIRLQWQSSGLAELRVSFVPDERVDTTLLIQDPAGRWHCDDDGGAGLNPSVLLPQPAWGDYAIWIGTFSRQPVAGELVVQEPPGGTTTADPPPTTPQSCGLAEAVYGDVEVGSRVALGRHRPVDGDANWNERMEAYVGQTAVVTGLSGHDPADCSIVQVDVDEGRWYWRLRDLELLDE